MLSVITMYFETKLEAKKVEGIFRKSVRKEDEEFIEECILKGEIDLIY